MSTLSVTNLNTANGTTDLTIQTGNTSNPGMVLSSGFGTLTVGNTSFNNTAISASSNSNIAISGVSNNSYGLYGFSTSSYGIVGSSNTSFGVVAQSISGTPLYAGNTTTQFMTVNSTAGMTLAGDAAITGNVTVSTNTLNLGTSSIVANGYSRLPNGLLFQWCTGTVTCNATTSNIVSLPTTFTTLYSASVVGNSAFTGAASNTGALIIYASNTSTLTIRSISGSIAASAAGFYIMAIGK